MIVIGIDIGMSGAIARVDSRTGECDIRDLPTMLAEENNAKARMRLSGYGIAKIILEWSEPGAARPPVFFENVQARHMGRTEGGPEHGNSIQSQGTLMRSRGIVESAIECMRGEIKPVHPQTWKRKFDLLKKPKYESRLLAIKLYPAAEHLLKRKKDIDRAEALLLAHFGMKELA